METKNNNARFEITEEMIKNGSDYMPLREKKTCASLIAKNCLRSMPTADQNLPSLKFLALPELLEEDLAAKAMMLLNTLLGFYLDITVPTSEDGSVTMETFDYYASSSPLNQLERFKSNAAVRDKVFNMISDYKEFKKMVDVEIYNRKQNANDPVSRFNSAVMLISKPENVKTLYEELKKAAAELADKTEKRRT